MRLSVREDKLYFRFRSQLARNASPAFDMAGGRPHPERLSLMRAFLESRLQAGDEAEIVEAELSEE